mgnify:CR=1 FL=1
MGYLLDESKQSIVNGIRDFMEKEVAPICAAHDRSGELPTEAYRKAFEMGLHCMEIPEEFGGAGIDYMTVAAASEEMPLTALKALGSASLVPSSPSEFIIDVRVPKSEILLWNLFACVCSGARGAREGEGVHGCEPVARQRPRRHGNQKDRLRCMRGRPPVGRYPDW